MFGQQFLLPFACFQSRSGGKLYHVSAPTRPLCFPQVDSITSMLRGAVVARAFEQTKCFTPGRGLQGKKARLALKHWSLFWTVHLILQHRKCKSNIDSLCLSFLTRYLTIFCSSMEACFFLFDGVALLPEAGWAAQWARMRKDDTGRNPPSPASTERKHSTRWKHCSRHLRIGAATSCCVTCVWCDCAVGGFQLLKKKKNPSIFSFHFFSPPAVPLPFTLKHFKLLTQHHLVAHSSPLYGYCSAT